MHARVDAAERHEETKRLIRSLAAGSTHEPQLLTGTYEVLTKAWSLHAFRKNFKIEPLLRVVKDGGESPSLSGSILDILDRSPNPQA